MEDEWVNYGVYKIIEKSGWIGNIFVVLWENDEWKKLFLTFYYGHPIDFLVSGSQLTPLQHSHDEVEYLGNLTEIMSHFARGELK